MKYWVFENGDVVGPFPPQELMGREGFGPHSLVCPEERGDDSSAWQEAVTYADFHFDEPAAEFAAPVVSDAEKKDVFDEELNTLLEEKSPIISPEKVKAEEPAENLHFPAHAPSKPGPIEDYFNNIKGEDLGNILGIPDPNENSDMNLARALKSQFAQTQPPHSEGESSVMDEDPFDAFTAKEDLNDKQESIEDDLAGVEPVTQQVPVVLAGKPQEDTFHPKYRIRKKQEEELLEKPAQEAASQIDEDSPAEEPVAPAPEDTLHAQAEAQPVQEAAQAPVQEEKITLSLEEPVAEPAKEPLPPEAAPAEAQDEDTTQQEDSISLSAGEPVVLAPQEEQTPVLKETPKEEAPLQVEASEEAPVDAPTQETAAQEEQSAPQTQKEPEPVLQEEGASSLQGTTLAKEEPLPEEEEDITSRLGLTLPDEPQLEEKPGLAEEKEQTLSKEPEEPLPAESPVMEPVHEEPVQQSPHQESQSKGEPAQKEQSQPVQDMPQEPALPTVSQAPAAANPAPKAEQPEPAPTTQEPAPTQDPVDEILQGAVAVTETPEVKEPIKEVTPVVDAQVNRVKPTLKKTAEIDKFLNEKIKEEKSRMPASKKMMWVLGFFIIILALLGLLWLLGQKPASAPAGQAAPAAPAVVKEGSAVDELMPDVDLDVPSAQEVLSSSAPVEVAVQEPQIPPQEKALQIVKEYNLPNSNGKIADYFDRIYKTKLAQGYSAVWSATPLHNNVYIVKYRISKTRLEPVVYLFQVDVAKNKLIGALNNITMDLVGKIN